ncbi:hypothetical protein GCG54_00015328 [Colletotrichum gloeosporioides]|uniref:Uncharacterized protein n=1 Tax=Colletotrichum gloeosporioides TaxID=474922 RepID=A0A8H4FFI3_COLGL|nr:uncharacterized protein GCG54_00015328 [Colletotrichum gloeosporioides]KAF3799144.1 hypothetical protein GCG54_00015328 [Colletotrichum gloeosporioides]
MPTVTHVSSSEAPPREFSSGAVGNYSPVTFYLRAGQRCPDARHTAWSAPGRTRLYRAGTPDPTAQWSVGPAKMECGVRRELLQRSFSGCFSELWANGAGSGRLGRAELFRHGQLEYNCGFMGHHTQRMAFCIATLHLAYTMTTPFRTALSNKNHEQRGFGERRHVLDPDGDVLLVLPSKSEQGDCPLR